MRKDCILNAFALLKQVLVFCWHSLGSFLQSLPAIALTVWGIDQKYHSLELTWSSTGTTSLTELAARRPAVQKVWEKLGQEGWCGNFVTSSLGSATLCDVLLFLAWTWGHQSQFNLWAHVGQHWFASLLFFTQSALDALAEKLSQQMPTPVPIVHHQGVKPRNLDPVNRLVLLNRIRKKFLHRKEIASTHSDVAPENLRMMKEECYYDSLFYSKRVEEVFSGCNHLQISSSQP